jgi:hypothetical protein
MQMVGHSPNLVDKDPFLFADARNVRPQPQHPALTGWANSFRTSGAPKIKSPEGAAAQVNRALSPEGAPEVSPARQRWVCEHNPPPSGAPEARHKVPYLRAERVAVDAIRAIWQTILLATPLVPKPPVKVIALAY